MSKNRPGSPMDLGELPRDRAAFDRWAAEHAKVDRRAELKRQAGSAAGHVLAWGALYVLALVVMIAAGWTALVVVEVVKGQPLLLLGAALVATAAYVTARNLRHDALENGGRR